MWCQGLPGFGYLPAVGFCLFGLLCIDACAGGFLFVFHRLQYLLGVLVADAALLLVLLLVLLLLWLLLVLVVLVSSLFRFYLCLVAGLVCLAAVRYPCLYPYLGFGPGFAALWSFFWARRRFWRALSLSGLRRKAFL